MVKRLLLPLFLFAFSIANAETIKTDVLVIGGGACGVAAAIQSARSKVKTLLIEPGPWLGGSMTMGGMCVLDANRNLPSGIWGEFRRKITDYYRPRLGYDTSHNAILRFEPHVGAEILKKITDTVKNLTVKLKTPWTSIRKDGSEWEVTIEQNGEKVTIKAKVVVDGTETGEVAAKAKAEFQDDGGAERKQVVTEIAILKDFGRNADKTIAKPEGYNQAAYSFLKGEDIKQMLKDRKIPNEKYMIDWSGYGKEIYASKMISSPDKFLLLKDSIYKAVKKQTLGLIYYLQTELGYKNLGLDDEFGTEDHLAPVAYVRQAMKIEGNVRMVLDDISKPYDRQSKLYRTSIGVGSDGTTPAFSIPLGVIVPKNTENLLVTEKAISVTGDVNNGTNNPAVQMTLGQGVGATAAYLAFFKTTTKHLTVRIIQGEILDYKGYLLPFTDVPQKDPHWRAIQQVCETGMLRGIQKKDGNSVEIHFEPNDTVRTAEVKPVLDEIYTRAFMWFAKEKPGEKLTLGNLLYFISDYTLTDPKTLELTISKLWKPVFKLPGELDVKRPVTRMEFAVLANKYLNPFAKTVDLSGKIVN
ncbi:MAG: FAD-dependent oxidoreductase [Sphingobacteriales bacterium]